MEKLNKIEKEELEELIDEIDALHLKWFIRSHKIFHREDDSDKLIVERYFEVCKLLGINVVELTGITPEDIIFDEDYYLFPGKWNNMVDCYNEACQQYEHLSRTVGRYLYSKQEFAEILVNL